MKLKLSTFLLFLLTAEAAVAFDYKPFGRVHWDYKFKRNDSDKTDESFRAKRIRAGVKGKILPELKYKLEADFADRPKVTDGYLKAKIDENLGIKIGQFKPEFDMDQHFSSNAHPFIDRSELSSANGLKRRLGAQAEYRDGVNHFSYGLFSNNSINQDSHNDGIITNARYTRSHKEQDFGHLVYGLGANITWPKQGGTSRVNKYNAQVFYQKDSLKTFGEGYLTYKDDEEENTGFYAAIAYNVMGKSNGLNSSGKLKRLKPENKHGALELKARYSQLHEQSSRLSDVTLGANYYINKYLDLMLEYTYQEERLKRQVSDHRLDTDKFYTRLRVVY